MIKDAFNLHTLIHELRPNIPPDIGLFHTMLTGYFRTMKGFLRSTFRTLYFEVAVGVREVTEQNVTTNIGKRSLLCEFSYLREGFELDRRFEGLGLHFEGGYFDLCFISDGL